jgi:hypothetical protein
MTDNPHQPFSRRHGYEPSDREIIIREEAPEEFRATLLHISEEVGLSPKELRDMAQNEPSSTSGHPAECGFHQMFSGCS